MVCGEALDSINGVVHLRHLLPHVSDKLLVIWDGAPIHTGEVKAFLTRRGAKHMHLEQLPPYAADLNPGEGVWQHLKNVELRHLLKLLFPARGPPTPPWESAHQRCRSRRQVPQCSAGAAPPIFAWRRTLTIRFSPRAASTGEL